MFRWSGYDWICNERWGNIHPKKTKWWYDPSSVVVDGNGYLNLHVKYNPKYFTQFNLTSNIGVGLISCVEKFHYGIYEIEAKLPKGKNLWPAFWMWSWDSWPPEIDVFEGYSDNMFGYFKFNPFKSLSFWDVQTNVHYTVDDKSHMVGGKKNLFTFKNPTKHFIKYKLIWTEESLKFYYNEKLVRIIDSPEIMYNINNSKMNVVLNNGITNGHEIKDIRKSTPFIVKYFKYTKL